MENDDDYEEYGTSFPFSFWSLFIYLGERA